MFYICFFVLRGGVIMILSENVIRWEWCFRVGWKFFLRIGFCFWVEVYLGVVLVVDEIVL